jgi:hypothetical protein
MPRRGGPLTNNVENATCSSLRRKEWDVTADYEGKYERITFNEKYGLSLLNLLHPHSFIQPSNYDDVNCQWIFLKCSN